MKKLTLILAAVAAFGMCAQAQQVLDGVIEVGDFSNASTTYNGSYFDMAPTNFYLAHTGAQLLYTPDLLADLDGKQNVKIEGMSFKFHSESFEDIIRDVKVYVQETNAVEFAVNEDGVKQFFDFDQTNAAYTDTYSYSLYDSYGEDAELLIPFSLNAPISYTPGKSLLVTIVFDAQDDDNCTMGSDYAPFYTSGISGKGMTYTNNWNSFLEFAQGSDFPNATATLGCGTNVELPVTCIKYTYTEGGGETPCLRGDTNLDGHVDITDVTALLDYLLSGQWPE